MAHRAEAFQAVGDWPEALNLVEASLLLNPSQPRLHRDAAEILGTMASELDPFHDPSRPQANTKAVAYLRASLPHLEAFYRETRVEPRDVAAVQSCWGALRWRVASPLGDRRIDRECRELYEDLTRMCGSVLAAKAAAKVQDYSLSQLAPYSEMPRPSGSTDAMARWDAESLPACCRHRLELLKAFQYLEVPQFGRLLWIDAGWPRDWDQPAYLKFLDEAEKLSRPEVVREARRVRAYIVSTRTWRPPPAPPLPARPAIDRGAAEVAFRRIDLMVRRPNGGEAFYSGCPLLWLPACDGMDVVLDEWALYVMRRPGRLVPLALPGHPNPNFAAGRQVTNACWDGRYVWFASPAANPGTPKRATGGGQSGLEYAPEGKPFLAAVEPATGKVWTFSAADGLPPMQSPGGPAVTPLEPGKICLAGHFGRSWCGVATLDPAAGIKLDIFYEAREVDPETNPANGQNVRLASPVVFLCTLTSAAAAGGPPQQRVLLNRQAAGTLLLDPRTRSVRLLPYRIPPRRSSAHDGMLYWEGFRRADNRTELYRTGFPDFHMELVNPESQFGFCLIEGNRLHVLGDRGDPLLVPRRQGPRRGSPASRTRPLDFGEHPLLFRPHRAEPALRADLLRRRPGRVPGGVSGELSFAAGRRSRPQPQRPIQHEKRHRGSPEKFKDWRTAGPAGRRVFSGAAGDRLLLHRCSPPPRRRQGRRHEDAGKGRGCQCHRAVPVVRERAPHADRRGKGPCTAAAGGGQLAGRAAQAGHGRARSAPRAAGPEAVTPATVSGRKC